VPTIKFDLFPRSPYTHLLVHVRLGSHHVTAVLARKTIGLSSDSAIDVAADRRPILHKGLSTLASEALKQDNLYPETG